MIEFWKNQLFTDLTKQILDFIDYAHINMTWWGFSFMKIVIPTYLIIYTEFLYDEQSTIIESRKENISFLPLLGACVLMSTLQFVVTPRIFVADYRPLLQKGEKDPFVQQEDGSDPQLKSIFENYRNCQREFIPMKKWLIVVKLIVFGAVSVCYFVFRGPQLAYAIYIPLDFLLELALLAYRVTEKFIIDREN